MFAFLFHRFKKWGAICVQYVLAHFARRYIQKHKPFVIGVSGSVGKSTARVIIAQILRFFLPSHLVVYTSETNFNGAFGLPLSIFCLSDFSPSFFGVIRAFFSIIRAYLRPCPYAIIVLEYGVDTPGEMDFLLSIVVPHIGVYTKSDAVHSEQFGNPQAIAQDDVKMIRASKKAVFLNADDIYARQLHKTLGVDTFFYKTTGEDERLYEVCDITYTDYVLSAHETTLVSSSAKVSVRGRVAYVSTNIFGKETMGYCAVGLAISDIVSWHFLKKTCTEVDAEYFFHLSLLPSRSSLFAGIKGSIILDSSYNSAPLSMRKILETAYNLKQEVFPAYHILVVMGDMRELGSFTQSEHRKIAGPLSMIAEKIVLVGKSTRYTQDELEKIGYPPSSIVHFQTAPLVLDFLRTFLDQYHDTKRLIVCKGSQNTIFLEDVVVGLLANPLDRIHVARQSQSRKEKKSRFYQKNS